jgi:tetratricopeptide (TPR) repeat protein
MKVLHTQTAALLERLFSLERCGRYNEALAELNDIWEDIETFPKIDGFEPRAAAEIVLRCGVLIGFHGHNKQISNSQEISKNILTEAHNRFLKIYDVEKIAECENYLALAYWRTGELVEAETWIKESLSRSLSNSNNIKIYALLIKSMILIANEKYEKAVSHLETFQASFLMYGDAFLNGSFCTNLGIALKNLNNLTEALKNLELARYYHRKSGHQIYLGTVENNLAQLYKSENKFAKAHEAIDSATKIFRQINDHTREGFSLDTKAQIYFAEKQYTDALKIIEKAIAILDKSENKAYLVESYSTKTKTLIYLDNFSAATFCLFEAVRIAEKHISEEAAKKLVKEYESVLQEKNSSVIEEMFSGKSSFEERLELILPPSISHYEGIQGVWIKNNHLAGIGLRKDSLAVVADEKINGGDLAAIVETATDAISCGFYDAAFGIVCLEGTGGEPQLFNEKDVRILGKIIGVCKSEKNFDGKMIVEPI